MCATFSRQQYSLVGNSNPSRQPHLAVSMYEAYHNTSSRWLRRFGKGRDDEGGEQDAMSTTSVSKAAAEAAHS